MPSYNIDNEIRELKIAVKAIQIFAETHPRPSQVTQIQAAEMLGLSSKTVSRMIKAGTISLNKLGMIPTVEVDQLLQVDHK